MLHQERQKHGIKQCREIKKNERGRWPKYSFYGIKLDIKKGK